MMKLGIIALLLAMPVVASADVYIFVNPHDDSYHVVRQAVSTEERACDPSYPTVCIPPGSGRLTCSEVGYTNFVVDGRDPYGFDRDHDGIGCER